jgi:transcriptional regulator with XRE-family HTH domain
MQTTKERLIAFLKHKKLSQAKFAEIIGVSSGYVNNMTENPTQETISKIKEKFPELNIDWLLKEEGEMLTKETSTDILNTTEDAHSITISKKAWDMIEKQAQIILSQQKTIESLSLRGDQSTVASA